MKCTVGGIALMVGCAAAPTGGESAAASRPEAEEPKPEPEAAPCRTSAASSRRTVTVDGVERAFELVVGPDTGASNPLLFVWHGWGSNPKDMLRAVAPAEHWSDATVIAPYGLDRGFEQLSDQLKPGWQISAGEEEDRDLKLFDALVEVAAAELCLDRARIYSTGFSNGGFFSNLLACRRGEVVAAVAPAGGGGPFPTQGCGPATPVAITHGRADRVVPFELATDAVAHWTRHNGCEAVPSAAGGCSASAGCPEAAPVEFCSFDGGHQWPAEMPSRIAKFLRRFTR